jgi:dipeptidyl aminopeptidase/acylaminoacyl peptidase
MTEGILAAVIATRPHHRRVRTAPIAAPRAVLIAIWTAFALVLLSLAAYFVACAVVADKLSHPVRSAISEPPGMYGLAYEDVNFNSTDGTPLSGWYIDAPNSQGRVIVMMHGRDGIRDGTPAMPVAAALAGAGYDVFTFDFRGHGLSGGERYSMGQWETRDVTAALEVVKLRGATTIGAYATSMGGATELRAAVEHPEIAAVMADSAFANLPELLVTELPEASGLPAFFNPGIFDMANLLYGIDLWNNKPQEAVAKLGDRPLYFVHSEVDTQIPSQHSRDLYATATAAGNPNVSIWIASGEGHCRAYQNHPEEYTARMLTFFDAYLK